MIAPDELAKALVDFLPKQRWFAGVGQPLDEVSVATLEVLQEPWPALLRVEADTVGGGERRRYQVLVGVRPAGEEAVFLEGSADLSLGELMSDAGPAYGYDALVDHELALRLLGLLAPGEVASHSRLLAAEQSNTSVVYDDRLFLKLYRRLYEGPNPDAEVVRALVAAGFAHVAEPLADWRHDDTDLAILQRFLSGGAEGWALALTSLRDLFATYETGQVQAIDELDGIEGGPRAAPVVDPAHAGGDFSAEARRLGEVTADMHVKLADAFGRAPGDAGSWAAGMEARLEQVEHPGMDREAVAEHLRALGGRDDVGPAIRVHGDFHLGQVMRTDAGWYVFDFGGEPARPLEERVRPTSPLKDVAAMLRSLQYATVVAMAEREEEPREEAVAWEARNRRAFLEGYLPAARASDLLPPSDDATAHVLGAFELDKAVYELGYELDHRPAWAGIPLVAIRRLLRGTP